MNTNNKSTIDHAVKEFRDAIASHVLIRSKDGALIVENEHTGERASWIFDFRALMLQAKWLDRYADIFWERYQHKLPFQVGGVESAGIPLVSAIVMKSIQRGHPVNGFYLRKSRKRQGLMKYIEGTLTDEPVIFVDDLINSGGSIRKQIDILAREHTTVSDAFVLLSYRTDDAYTFLKERNVTLDQLFTLPDFGLKHLPSAAVAEDHNAFNVVWHFEAPSPSMHLVVQKSAPALDETNVYFGCDDGVFRALDQKTGRVAWTFEIGKHPQGKGILSSAKLHDGRVYFGAYDGSTYALDASSGSLAWRNDDADWVGSSPDIAPDLGLLFIGLEFGLWKKRGGIAAIDIRTGKTLWSAHHPSLTHGSPLYVNDESLVVIGSNNGHLYAYDAKTGALRWTFATRGDIKTRPAFDKKRNVVVCASMDGTVYALSARDGSPLFARELRAGVYSTPLVHNDTIYVSSLDKCVYAIDATYGNDRWVYETDGRIFSSPIIANGSLWIGSNDGKLRELDPETGRLRAFFQATERIVNAVAIHGDRIYVPTVANEIYCIKKANR